LEVRVRKRRREERGNGKLVRERDTGPEEESGRDDAVVIDCRLMIFVDLLIFR